MTVSRSPIKRAGDSVSSDFYCDEVLSGRTKVERLHETASVLAFRHTRPSYVAHVAVIPKRHILSLLEAAPAELAEMMEMIQTVAAEVLDEFGACRVVTNLGRYQESKHLHWHVVADPAEA